MDDSVFEILFTVFIDDNNLKVRPLRRRVRGKKLVTGIPESLRVLDVENEKESTRG